MYWTQTTTSGNLEIVYIINQNLMKVFNALQLKNGAKAKTGSRSASSSLTQPVQFLSAKQKNEDWAAWNLDWLEVQGMNFLKGNSRRLLKNYKLAKGIIDKTDYITEPDNDYKELMDVLTKTDQRFNLEQWMIYHIMK